MRKLLTCLGALTLTACADLRAMTGNERIDEIQLTKEFYEWHCDNRGNIIVSTETHECSETGLHYIVAEAYLYDGNRLKTNLKNPNACVDSHWEETIPIAVFDYHCENPGFPSDVDGVTLAAYADEGTWAGVVFGN